MSKKRKQCAARALSRLAEAREELSAAEERCRAIQAELRAAQEDCRAPRAKYHAAAREAEEAALPEDEKLFRQLWPPGAWHHDEDVWEYHRD